MTLLDRLLLITAALTTVMVAALLIAAQSATLPPAQVSVALPTSEAPAAEPSLSDWTSASAKGTQRGSPLLAESGNMEGAAAAERLRRTLPAAAAPTDALPLSVAPLAVPNHPQERNLNCEFRSASDLAAYYGISIAWETLFLAVGHDPNGDPDVGFVGRSIDDEPGGIYPAGYGVHAAPIASGLSRLGVPATAYRGMGREWLQALVAGGDPVVVWATAGLGRSQVVQWETRDGRLVSGVPTEHTFTVVGYDEEGIWLNDPWDGSMKHYSWERFERAWALMDQQAVVIKLPER